jgi:hypothetical protein
LPANLVAEVKAREPKAKYKHEMMLALDQEAQDSILNKLFWMDGNARVRNARFPGLAKTQRLAARNSAKRGLLLTN